MELAEKMKSWPMLAAHRMAEIEAVLLSFDARLAALEPKHESKVDEPKALLAPPDLKPNPLDGERTDS